MFSSEEPEQPCAGRSIRRGLVRRIGRLAQRPGDLGHAAVRLAAREAPAPGDHDDAEADQAAARASEARRARRRRHRRINIRTIAATSPRRSFRRSSRAYAGTRLGRQELDAELLEDTHGALWTRELIEEGRRPKADIPPMRRIVVAVDPAVSVSESVGRNRHHRRGLWNGRARLCAGGRERQIQPDRVGVARAVALYHKWNADRIVAESNQGGAMVETTVRTVDPNVEFQGRACQPRQDHARRADRGARPSRIAST